MVARHPCELWALRRRLSSFGFTPRSFGAERRPARSRGQKSGAHGCFSRRTLQGSFARSMFNGGKRCK